MLTQNNSVLNIYMVTSDGYGSHANYSLFKVDDETNCYNLTVSIDIMLLKCSALISQQRQCVYENYLLTKINYLNEFYWQLNGTWDDFSGVFV